MFTVPAFRRSSDTEELDTKPFSESLRGLTFSNDVDTDAAISGATSLDRSSVKP